MEKLKEISNKTLDGLCGLYLKKGEKNMKFVLSMVCQ